MKIYDYSGRANISGDRIHQARTAQRLSIFARVLGVSLVWLTGDLEQKE